MYVLTGGAGFIGSVFLRTLNERGIGDIIVVDSLGSSEKWKNLRGKRFAKYYHKDEFLDLIRRDALPYKATAVIHMGACSATTEQNCDYLMRNNVDYSVTLAEYCAKKQLRFIYASSGAVYGDGSQGYSDCGDTERYHPLNGYGFSKQKFDLWIERQGFQPAACGLRFFNVYGPNEYHKGAMRSVVVKAWQQIKADGVVKLFRSNNPQFADGEQKRDFIYVKDCCAAMWWLLENSKVRGIFNLGSGSARTWNSLAKAVFDALGRSPKIEYIDMPSELRSQYQNFTQAEMNKLREAGYGQPFISLEEGIRDYVQNHLEAPTLFY